MFGWCSENGTRLHLEIRKGVTLVSQTTYTGNVPTAEDVLSTLYKLYGQQMGVKITYTIVDGKDETNETKNNAGHH